MSALEIRGAFPKYMRLTAANGAAVGTAGFDSFDYTGAQLWIRHIQITNEGANNLRIYENKAAYDADSGLTLTDGFLVLGTSSPGNFYEAPLELNEGRLLMRSEAATTDVVVAMYLRRI